MIGFDLNPFGSRSLPPLYLQALFEESIRLNKERNGRNYARIFTKKAPVLTILLMT